MFFALLDDNFSRNGRSYLFRTPRKFLSARSLGEVPETLAALEAARRDGLYTVGFAAYELAAHYGFETLLDEEGENPLLHFGVFDAPEVLTDAEVEGFLADNRGPHSPYLAQVEPDIDEAAFEDALNRIKSHLEAGNSYQVNFTYRIRARLGGCPFAFYDKLRRAQPVEYGAFLNFPGTTVLSRSPELFFEKTGTAMRVKPMKGTAPRHPHDRARDLAESEALPRDEKQVAENVMIVDLLRNDLGRIAEPGSVTVPRLFEVESYRTVHQMTSTVACRVAAGLTLDGAFAALFPCGSVTGAPKARTCEIIKETETNPRGVYTGAIGMVTPDNDMIFNVPIRTFVTDGEGCGTFGVGSGITHGSEIAAEYRECRLKGRFLLDRFPDFRVLDCFHFAPTTGRRNADLHLARLEKSCRALGFPYSPATVEREIARALTDVEDPSKVRIEVAGDGNVSVEAVPLGEFTDRPRRTVLSDKCTSSADYFYRHKTTNRALYDAEFRHYRGAFDIYDVIFANERGELTEACHHNLVLRFGDTHITPPLDAGVLDGVGRRLFIEERGERIRVEPVPRARLFEADEILLVSSIRGVLPVTLVDRTTLIPAHERLEHA